MPARDSLRHVGGGQKGLYLLLRYVFIAAVSYLLLMHAGGLATPALSAFTIAGALASNVALSAVRPATLFRRRTMASLLVVDTLWVAWALHAFGGASEDLYLLLSTVLVLAAVSEQLLVVVAGAAIASVAIVYEGWTASAPAASPVLLLRAAFLFTAAVFYGHVLGRIRAERRRADATAAWAASLEAMVAERTAELQRLYEASSAASRAKSDVIASVSHELRSPLQVVIGYADILAGGGAATPEDGAVFGRRIRNAAKTLLRLVDNVLEAARLDSGAVGLDVRRVDVAGFAHALARREWPTPHPGVALRWRIGAGDAVVETDPGKLEIVLANVVNNALKYTTAGEVVVAVRDRAGAGEVEFRVTDTGPGIPAERLARLREPFHESTVVPHRGRGVGLGLSIVHRWAEHLGATVEIESVEGAGTTIVVTVPHRLRDVGATALAA